MYLTAGETCQVECHPEHNYVIKKFRPRKPKFGWREVDPLRKSLNLCFYREVTCLERLRSVDGFPTLIDCNKNELWIKMSYVGQPFLHFAKDDKQKYIDQVDNLVDALAKHDINVAYEWTPGDKKIGYCLSMMMVQGYKLSLIDFERAYPLGCSKEKQFGQYFTSSFVNHDNEEFKQILKDTISTPKDTLE